MAFKGTRGVRLVVKVSNGLSPEVFTPLCTINAERGITFNAHTQDDTVPDCDDPEAIKFLSREKQSLSVDVTGGGKNNKSDNKILWDWWKSPDPKRCQVVLDDDTPANVITWEGDFHLTQWNLTGDDGQKVTTTTTLSSDGEVEAVFGSAVGGS